MYGDVIDQIIPGANHDSHVRHKEAKENSVVNMARSKRRATRDPLFMVNHMCAKLRADISRLARRTWATSKKMERLQDHLLIYAAFQNQYSIA